MQEPTIPQSPGLDPNPVPVEDQMVVSSNSKREGFWSVASTIMILVAAPLIALLLINFVFQSYEVDGPSMESTLQNHDRLIVWKVPRTIAKVTKHPFIPARGKIIIFVKHGLYDQGVGGDKQLIKRVIGLPGDRVVVRDGSVTIYNADHPQGFEPDKTLGYGKMIPTTTGNVDLVVPPGEIFVCGDNRVNSLDSRIFGTVSSSDVIGELSARIFPVNKVDFF
jgi:signal peptidase I